MNRRFILRSFLVLAGAGAAGAGAVHAQTGKAGGMNSVVIEDVSLEDLKRGLKDGSIVLVDVRERNEWDAGHIPGAQLNPLSTFDVSKLPAAAPGKRIVLQCRSGNRSKTALAQAQASGRADIKAHFGGGMLGWTAAGEKAAQ